MKAYLLERTRFSRNEHDQPCRVHVFYLSADAQGERPIRGAQFPHEERQEACQQTLRFIETWARQSNVEIVNPELWALGKAAHAESR